MEILINGAMVIEAALLSFLLALWITWLGLRGLFVLMPASPRNVPPVLFTTNGEEGSRRRNAA